MKEGLVGSPRNNRFRDVLCDGVFGVIVAAGVGAFSGEPWRRYLLILSAGLVAGVLAGRVRQLITRDPITLSRFR